MDKPTDLDELHKCNEEELQEELDQLPSPKKICNKNKHLSEISEESTLYNILETGRFKKKF